MIEQEVGDVVRERPPDEEFHGHVINAFGIGFPVGLVGKHPTLGKNVADRSCESFVMFAGIGYSRVHLIVIKEVTRIESAQTICKLGRSVAKLGTYVRRCWGAIWFRDDRSSTHKILNPNNISKESSFDGAFRRKAPLWAPYKRFE